MGLGVDFFGYACLGVLIVLGWVDGWGEGKGLGCGFGRLMRWFSCWRCNAGVL